MVVAVIETDAVGRSKHAIISNRLMSKWVLKNSPLHLCDSTKTNWPLFLDPRPNILSINHGSNHRLVKIRHP